VTTTATQAGATVVSSLTQTELQTQVVTSTVSAGGCEFILFLLDAVTDYCLAVSTILVPVTETQVSTLTLSGGVETQTKEVVTTVVQGGTTVYQTVPVTTTVPVVMTTTIAVGGVVSAQTQAQAASTTTEKAAAFTEAASTYSAATQAVTVQGSNSAAGTGW
jgi:hypothetical protein